MDTERTSSKELIAQEHPLMEHFDSKAIRSAAEKVPSEYWLLPDVELIDKAKPTEIEQRLRVSILLAYMNWLKTGKKIKLADVTSGICSYTHLYDNILKHPYKFVFLFRAIQWVGLRAEHLLPHVMSEICRMLDLPITEKDGRFLHRNAEQQLRVFSLINDLLYGSPKNPSYVPLKDRQSRELREAYEQTLRTERLALERDRLTLEQERLAFEKEREAARLGRSALK